MKLRKKNALPLLDLESSSSGSEYEEGEDEDGSSCPYSSHAESSEWETDEEGAAAEQAHTVGLIPVRKSGNEAGAGAVYDTDAAAGPRAVDPVPPVLRPNPAAMSAVQYQPCRVRSASTGAGDRTGAGPHNVFQVRSAGCMDVHVCVSIGGDGKEAALANRALSHISPLQCRVGLLWHSSDAG